MTTNKHVLASEKTIEILPSTEIVMSNGDHFLTFTRDEAIEMLIYIWRHGAEGEPPRPPKPPKPVLFRHE